MNRHLLTTYLPVTRSIFLLYLQNMVDFIMTTPLQDESVTRTPLQILTDLLTEVGADGQLPNKMYVCVYIYTQ